MCVQTIRDAGEELGWSREDAWLWALSPATEDEKDSDKRRKVLERKFGLEFQGEGPDSAQNQAFLFFST